MTKHKPYRPPAVRQALPRSFKELTPSRHFNPRTFFHEMVLKALLTRRTGESRAPVFPKLSRG
ncbi:MAG TPA: MBL fold metallo-hydrolase, partial [Clostridia bacterium]|nr:MBL fold metallo-hydrolase [Clostridia bacterium]